MLVSFTSQSCGYGKDIGDRCVLQERKNINLINKYVLYGLRGNNALFSSFSYLVWTAFCQEIIRYCIWTIFHFWNNRAIWGVFFLSQCCQLWIIKYYITKYINFFQEKTAGKQVISNYRLLNSALYGNLSLSFLIKIWKKSFVLFFWTSWHGYHISSWRLNTESVHNGQGDQALSSRLSVAEKLQ